MLNSISTQTTIPEHQPSSQSPRPTVDASAIREAAEEGIPAWTGWCPREPRHRNGVPLVVCVHGISRDDREQIARFRPAAEHGGYALLAPLFDEKSYPDFQRLGRRGKGQRADLGLVRAIQRFRERTNRAFEDVFLVGFSGGGQFVHRFVMAHPERVRAAVVTAAGWYTLPLKRRLFPGGIRLDASLSGVRFEPDKFLRTPVLVAVGAEDKERDKSFRTNDKLDAAQGRNRVERAHTWSRAMTEAAFERGIHNEVRAVELPGAAHSFAECIDAGLDRLTFEFFDHFVDTE